MSKQDLTKLSRTDLLAIVLTKDAEAHAKMLAAPKRQTTKAILISWIEAFGTRTMAQTLLAYRGGYQDTVAYSGRLSLNNGGEVALFLAGMEPGAVMTAAERILGLEAGYLTAKYAHLNPGQQRMNSGNRISAALKRGDITPKDLH